MNPDADRRRRIGRALAAAAATGVALALLAAALGWHQLGVSRAQLDGEHPVPGLGSPVEIRRDRRGTATVQARNRLDQARGVGFVHAQERFFQMDLARRSAAGELAALLGETAVPTDRRHRVHRLRAVARRALERWPPEYRRMLRAYAGGVNAGLAGLGGVPPEYRLLRATPEPWRQEDSVLTVMAMYFALQDPDGARKRSLWAMEQTLPEALVEFLRPAGSAWDAPVTGERFRHRAVPGSEVFDLRRVERALLPELAGERSPPAAPARSPGSNNWALAGERAAGSGALVAVDMHLGLQVPGTWFRLELERPDPRRPGSTLAVGGLSLPGMPFIVAGANRDIAWGYTNSNGDWTEVTRIELDPDDPRRYRVPGGWAVLEVREETIEVRGAASRTLTVRVTRHGPIAGELPGGGGPYAVRWVAQEPRAHQPFTAELDSARSVTEALDIAVRAGIPAQNFVVGDAAGRIGWTIKGRIPRRTAAASPSVREAPAALAWDGWLPRAAYPRIENPAAGALWSANSRVVGGPALALIGDGGYDLGARATQIRDRLFALAPDAGPAEMLRIQLDDEALFLGRWRALVLETLAGVDPNGAPAAHAARAAVAQWGGHAAVASVGYRIVRRFRDRVIDWLARTLTAPVRRLDPDFVYRDPAAEAWVWPLLEQRPAHLLPPEFESWARLQRAALDAVLAEAGVTAGGDRLDAFTWGARNTVRVRHPLSGSLGPIGRWLDMPPVALPGDRHMPRVQAPRFGASQRFAIAAGDREGAILHLAGGQSGHPRSPFYGAGHEDWVAARPTPLLPGPAAHLLHLVPHKEQGRE